MWVQQYNKETRQKGGQKIRWLENIHVFAAVEERVNNRSVWRFAMHNLSCVMHGKGVIIVRTLKNTEVTERKYVKLADYIS